MRIFNLFIAIGLVFFAISCEEEEFKPATVAFYPTLNLRYIEPELTPGIYDTVFVELSRKNSVETQVKIDVNKINAEYGVNYETFPPELTEGELVLTFEPNNPRTYFLFYPKRDSALIGSNYIIEYELADANGAIKSVSKSPLTIVIEDGDPSDCFPDGVIDTVIAEYNFNNCENLSIPDGFTEVFVEGAKSDRGWGCRPFGFTGGGVQASDFGGQSGTGNAWLIMDPFNADEFKNIVINFYVESFFEGDGELNIWYSNNYAGSGDPRAEGVVWIDMFNVSGQLPGVGSQEFVEVVTAPCFMEGEEVFIAFQFIGGKNNNSSSWTIDDLLVKGVKK